MKINKIKNFSKIKLSKVNNQKSSSINENNIVSLNAATWRVTTELF